MRKTASRNLSVLAATASPPATPLKSLVLHDDEEEEQEQQEVTTKPRVSQRVLELGASSLAQEDKATDAAAETPISEVRGFGWSSLLEATPRS